jgi:hypothetical protein
VVTRRPGLHKRIAKIVRWRMILSEGSDEQKAELVESLSDNELQVAAEALDIPDETVELWLECALRDLLIDVRRRPFEPPD